MLYFLRIILLMILCALPVDSSFADSPSVHTKVGFILSLSGPLAQWCSYMREGIELAQSENPNSRIEVIFEDDRSADKTAALSAAHALVHQKRAEIVYSWTSATMQVVASVTNQRKIPFVVGSYDALNFSKTRGVYPAFVNYDLVASDMAKVLYEKSRSKKVALITSTDTWSAGFIAPFLSTAGTLPWLQIEQVEVSPDERDLSTIVLTLKRKGIDSIAAPLYGSPLLALLREVYKAKLTASLHVADGIFEEDIAELGQAAEGVLASQVWLTDQHFAERYEKKYKRTLKPTQLGLVAEGYDIFSHFQQSVAEYENTRASHRLLREILLRTKSMGVLGTLNLASKPPVSGHQQVFIHKGRFLSGL